MYIIIASRNLFVHKRQYFES